MKKTILLLITIALIFSSCKRVSEGSKSMGDNIKNTVSAFAETDPVPQHKDEDSADDPAIWINQKDVSKSFIIGTDKKGGLATYDLNGKQLNYYPVGKINNCDLRYGFVLNNDTIDILAASHRNKKAIVIYKISENGVLDSIHSRTIATQMKDIYGMCMYKSSTTNQFYVYINSKTGNFEQWELFTDDDKIDAKLVRSLKVPSQPEGMVADDSTNILYVGEEKGGIWKFNAQATEEVNGDKIATSTEANEFISYDIEGLTIYSTNSVKYLVASSQGNYTYAVFDLNNKDNYLGSFKIAKETIDAVEETDGIDVVSVALPNYPKGLLVVQDGYNYENGKLVAQNFKYISWQSVEESLGLK